ncbi:steryl acetyl hydrolase [Hirsutella rhossiliensis]|uniref:Steryl acetyl hydrolase domain-containing protein n=1 Tax=Hirsutella rhossiliensis TaxID=111463 RepID=A0A9P8SJY5_9HYPO|nr:steryl acetyl hydrolase domain-containing protein [Hirsutella rhossiliensis]KAH0963546.1 steryl acetyl hydrolase domain-containing protein [Hirsutella rhossiliensis]
MILGPVSLVDCLVFCIFLAPQLIWHVGLVRTCLVALQALPFLVLQLPFQLVRDRLARPMSPTASLPHESTVFEDVVVRCVRYAFRAIPTSVNRVFFSKGVALPFLRWRMLRHGYLDCPVHWHEHRSREGLWIRHKPDQPPDLVVYYVHGGGFALGSCYFYLEFLLAWHSLLVDAGFQNPAVFALDYTLVPDAGYPTQMLETLQGYRHVLEVAKDASRVCVAGDSAGGTLILSLLLQLGSETQTLQQKGVSTVSEPSPLALAVPRTAALISPWVKLKSHLHYPSMVDYLNRQTLWKYAHEYAGAAMLNQQPASPGSCVDEKLWRAASPERGYVVVFGEQEVFAPDIGDFINRRVRSGIETKALRFDGGVHAWPVASLFLSSTADRRLQGLRWIVGQISKLSDTKMAGKDGGSAAALRLDQVDSHGLAR